MIMACHTSAYGLGTVLSHIMPDKSEKPIMFNSRTLTNAERKYSQIEKEVLANLVAVKKVHKYICDRTVTIQKDHKLLLGLLAEHKTIPVWQQPQFKDLQSSYMLTIINYIIGQVMTTIMLTV